MDEDEASYRRNLRRERARGDRLWWADERLSRRWAIGVLILVLVAVIGVAMTPGLLTRLLSALTG